MLNFLNSFTKNLFELTLRGNPFMCDCSTINFFNFTRTSHIIVDLDNVTCQKNEKFISKMTLTDFCPNQSNNDETRLKWNIFWIVMGLISFCFFYCIYNIYLKRLLKRRFGHRLIEFDEETEETNVDEENYYDVFVSYSQDDHDFVMNELVRMLENGSMPLQLYLPYRDWSVKEWTPTNIVRSVKFSRHIMMVVSSSFLENVWGKAELRAAFCQTLNKDQSDVTLILYDDIEPTDEHLDSELKAYMNANFYIKWGDPWFWKKLKQLLNRSEPADRRSMQTFESLFFT